MDIFFEQNKSFVQLYTLFIAINIDFGIDYATIFDYNGIKLHISRKRWFFVLSQAY